MPQPTGMPAHDDHGLLVSYGLLSEGGRGLRVRTKVATANPRATAATAIATVNPSEYPTTDTCVVGVGDEKATVIR